MSALQIVLGVLLIIVSIALTVIVMVQEENQQGLSGAIAGGGDTFYGKNKGRTTEAKLKKFTKIIGAAFLILSLAAVLLFLFFA